MYDSPRTGIGLIVSGLLAAASPAMGDLVLDVGSFDGSAAPGHGWPGVVNTWGGDAATIVQAERGITPYAGSGMLRFDSAGGGTASSLSSGDLYQTIDVTPYATAVAAGQVRVTASAWFNRVAGDSQTDTQFGIGLRAFAGSPSRFPSVVTTGVLDMDRSFIQTDRDAATWQQATVELVLPTNTSYFSVWIAPQENVFNDTQGDEFDGHYADAVSLRFAAIPTPGTWLIAGVGGLIALVKKI